jgi:DNA-binding response OmpR family regulator
LRDLRRRRLTTPVLLLTARAEVEDRVQGLDAGADDYLTKPFSMVELQARIRALLRRQRPELQTVLRVADLELDQVSRVARRGRREIQLTNREFALLELLMVSSPRVVGKTAIIERVWDQHFDSGTNVVNVYIRHLREKLNQEGEPDLLQTVRGVGFALREP